MFWYHPDLERLENQIKELEYHPKTIFYGSSTLTLWNNLTTTFKEHKPINLGFGGSTLAACTWFFDRIFENIKDIDAIVIYAGDNDLGDGRHPEEIILFLENLLFKIRTKYGNIKCTCISIKPSIARSHLQESINYTNKNIQKLMSKDDNFHFVNIYDALLDKKGEPNSKYFEEDGLHFNSKGYNLLEKTLQKHPKIFPQKILEKTF
ncbi:GDSL family lipase [Polaribacter sejongensis]|uniref:GDSL family lipase n=1 Tax=Polaribacter sejongensis TaxID=985043 RepID=A0AAJ1VG36_9FLAO|nr:MULTISPECIES: GDSL-type esterase/lipase family protein [Polaribacter]AUC22883.1 GDSL family lipase [Polaribacter sejongensis]MDN3618839.1 GDSL-type esterase/lipase family protein [Polaribacter undariae]UWD32929.1 GDSL-type esterase/lipase family protein [Polaribacter undariae]